MILIDSLIIKEKRLAANNNETENKKLNEEPKPTDKHQKETLLNSIPSDKNISYVNTNFPLSIQVHSKRIDKNSNAEIQKTIQNLTDFFTKKETLSINYLSLILKPKFNHWSRPPPVQIV